MRILWYLAGVTGFGAVTALAFAYAEAGSKNRKRQRAILMTGVAITVVFVVLSRFVP